MREASFVKQNKEKWIVFEKALDNKVPNLSGPVRVEGEDH